MAHEAHLFIEDVQRQLLTFKLNYFKVANSVIYKWSNDNRHGTLDSLYAASQVNEGLFYSNDIIPFGGIIDLTMESTESDEWLYDWFVPLRDSGTALKHGRIDFFGEDEFQPFKRVEFWDTWIPTISEAMSSTGTDPMILSLQLSPATIRYNREVVVRKVWYITDIDKKNEKHTEKERELFVRDIKWKGRKADYISPVYRKDMMLNHNLTLEVGVRDHLPGDSFELQVKQSNGRRIKGNSTEFTVTGNVSDEGDIVLIENFKVECDFAEDNQNFGNIEFYHKGRKVAEFKENFGWDYIVEGGITKIFVGIELDTSAISDIVSDETIKEYINNCFERTLENSSQKTITGKIFFNGTFILELPQYVPKVEVIQGIAGNGAIYKGKVLAEVENNKSDDNLTDMAITVIHELMHSVRLDHPFERVQTDDSKLYNEGFNRYSTSLSTDENMAYNIMLYPSCIINGFRLRNLWKKKKPEYLTKGQLSIVFKEINAQKKGRGTYDKYDATTLTFNENEILEIRDNEMEDELNQWSTFDWYWTFFSGKKIQRYRHRETRKKPD